MTTPPTALPGQTPLQEHDPELFELMQKEKERQFEGLEMIASENFTSRAVQECLGSCLTNKYSEGYPGARYYGGNQWIDKIETLAQTRALAAFHLDPEVWAVNVQPLSGCPANFAVYAGLMQPGDKLVGMNLPDGGHLSHGYQLENGKKISKVSMFFDVKSYGLTDEGRINYEQAEQVCKEHQPKILVGGYSAHPRDMDYAAYRKAADAAGALLMIDIAHISGLVASGEMNNPFEYSDIVTTTTHKSLRGPRSGMIFTRKDKSVNGHDGKPMTIGEAVAQAVFPGMQGGPHVHQIAGVATQLKEVATPEFKEYCQRVKKNAAALAAGLVKEGHTIATGGTENHMVMFDCRPHGLTGSKVDRVLEYVDISVNKNTLQGDKSAMNPGGLRFGTCALTTRGLGEPEMEKIAGFVTRAVQIAQKVQESSGKMIAAFTKGLVGNEEVAALKAEVNALARTFPMPGL